MGGGDRGGVDIFSLIINQGVFLFPKGPLIHPNLLLSLFTPTPFSLFLPLSLLHVRELTVWRCDYHRSVLTQPISSTQDHMLLSLARCRCF